MSNLPSSDELDTLFQGLKSIVTHPELQKVSEELQNLPPDQRSQAIATLFTPESLAARGISIPDGMSISAYSIESSDDPVSSTARATLIQPSAKQPPPSNPLCIRLWGLVVLCGHNGGPSGPSPVLPPPPPDI